MADNYDRKAPKQTANLRIDRDLLVAARESGVNLSEVLEEALAEKLAAEKRQRWVRENSSSIAAYNSFVEENGLASDGRGSF